MQRKRFTGHTVTSISREWLPMAQYSRRHNRPELHWITHWGFPSTVLRRLQWEKVQTPSCTQCRFSLLRNNVCEWSGHCVNEASRFRTSNSLLPGMAEHAKHSESTIVLTWMLCTFASIGGPVWVTNSGRRKTRPWAYDDRQFITVL